MKKSELRQMIREVLKEELLAGVTITESSTLKFRKSDVPTEAYVIMTDDGPTPKYQNLFLTFDDKHDCYTTVRYLGDVGRFDCHNSIAAAEERAEDANSGTFGGWSYPMNIIKITNFKAAYFGLESPKYTIVKTLTF